MDMVKYILFIFNLICALCGIALLSVGIAVLLKYDDIIRAFDEINVNVAPILFIVIGSIIFVIAFFGCCGAIRESHCMVSTYAAILFIILVCEVILGVLIFVNVKDVQRHTESLLQRLWSTRVNHRALWDGIQSSLECCGLNNASDWGNNLPKSCCPSRYDTCHNLLAAYSKPCSSAVREFIQQFGTIFGSTALAVAGIQLVGFIFSCILANSIRNQERRYA